MILKEFIYSVQSSEREKKTKQSGKTRVLAKNVLKSFFFFVVVAGLVSLAIQGRNSQKLFTAP
jgi:hypothetical protein